MGDSDATVDQRYVAAVATVARQLVDGPDALDTVATVVRELAAVLDATEVGVMVADRSQNLRVLGSSSERLRTLELFELQHSEGPCPDAFRDGTEVLDVSLEPERCRWPHLAPAAEPLGFRRASALPLLGPDGSIGAMNLFLETDRDLTPDELGMARSFADLASICIIRDRSEATVLQLQHALDSRVVIEQAKGALASQLGIDTDVAFELLRNYARSNNRRLTEVGQELMDGIVPIELTETVESA